MKEHMNLLAEVETLTLPEGYEVKEIKTKKDTIVITFGKKEQTYNI